MTQINSSKNYTTLENPYQLFLPLDVEPQIPEDDPVRLVRYCIGGMKLSALYQHCHHINQNQASPRQMLAILVYACMQGIVSTRKIEEACRYHVKFMYLLEGKPAPDHTTIYRFLTKHLRPCIREVLAQMDILFDQLGVLSLKDLFLDGTKIESVANKYKFVWKKTILKNRDKMLAKLPAFVTQAETEFQVPFRHGENIQLRHLKKLRRKLNQKRKEANVVFVHGSGKRKTPLQRTFEQLDEYISRLKEYQKKLHILGNRNSYAKTDEDATFMRLKEDAMRNGQLKPAYNIQYGSDAEFIVWADIGPQTTDTGMLIPFLEGMKQYVPNRYENLVADAGYESEENYTYLEEQGQRAYIKPTNYETSKMRKWKKDIGRFENMTYLAEEDAYLCANGRKIQAIGTYRSTTKTGYTSEKTRYRCESCRDCTRKEQCIHGNHFKKPLEERVKQFTLSKKFLKQRQEDRERILSPEGIELRVNRSIQAEGAFADIKAGMRFRRFLHHGMENARVTIILLAMAHNIQKLHHKIQHDTVSRYRIPIKITA